MSNKTCRKELSSEIIAVILALHKITYTVSQIGKEEGLTKDIPQLHLNATSWDNGCQKRPLFDAVFDPRCTA
jgi:hypothetical protein